MYLWTERSLMDEWKNVKLLEFRKNMVQNYNIFSI